MCTHPHFLFLRGFGGVVGSQALGVIAVSALVTLQQLLWRDKSQSTGYTALPTEIPQETHRFTLPKPLSTKGIYPTDFT